MSKYVNNIWLVFFLSFLTECLERVEKIVEKKVKYYKCDILDSVGMDKIFTAVNINIFFFYGFYFYAFSIRNITESFGK